MSEKISAIANGPRQLKTPAKACDRETMDDTLLEVFGWIDALPLNRSKSVQSGRLHREFADGRVVAEILALHFPKLIQKHNYPVASSILAKRTNWETMRRKVLEKLEIILTDDQIEMIIHSRVGGIEGLLKNIYDVAQAIQQSKAEAKERMEAESKAEAHAEAELKHAKTCGPWIPYNSCFGRMHNDGREEIVVCGKAMIDKAKHDSIVAAMDGTIAEKDAMIKKLRSQVARLQMTVGLKEEHLVDLTKEVCKLRGDFHGQAEGVDTGVLDALGSLELATHTFGGQGDEQGGSGDNVKGK